jgi:hypothetical protein
MLFPQSFIRVWFFWESRLQHKCTWWLQVLWKFRIFLKFLKFWNFEILWKFWNFELWNFYFFFINLRWSFNYESNVFRYNKILIDCVFRNSKFVVPSTLTIDLGFAPVNSQCLRDNKLAIPSYPVNKYILLDAHIGTLMLATVVKG